VQKWKFRPAKKLYIRYLVRESVTSKRMPNPEVQYKTYNDNKLREANIG